MTIKYALHRLSRSLPSPGLSPLTSRILLCFFCFSLPPTSLLLLPLFLHLIHNVTIKRYILFYARAGYDEELDKSIPTLIPLHLQSEIVADNKKYLPPLTSSSLLLFLLLSYRPLFSFSLSLLPFYCIYGYIKVFGRTGRAAEKSFAKADPLLLFDLTLPL